MDNLEHISIDFGILDLALVGDYGQIDLFGSTINLCSKINSTLSIANQIIIGDNFYRILKSFSNITTYPFRKKILGSSSKNHIETQSKKGLSYHKKNSNKRVILIDDDEDILFTYKSFLKGNGYEIITFTNSINALNYIKNLSNFDNLLVTLDIRMKDLNGFQLHQQINSIDPTIKIIFITALDIVEEILTIVPGLSKDQIIRKPTGKKLFTNTVN